MVTLPTVFLPVLVEVAMGMGILTVAEVGSVEWSVYFLYYMYFVVKSFL